MAWPPCLSMPHGPCLSAAASFAGRRLAPNLQGAVHPTTTLVCWQVRRPPTARVVAILRHHHPGARHGPPARPVDEQGAAHTACPPRTTTTQPTHRLLSVDGRRPLDAALEAVLDVCQAAELGCSVAALWSSRRPPCACPCLGVRRCPERSAPEVRTAVDRRAGRPPLAGRSARTHGRVRGALEPLVEL